MVEIHVHLTRKTTDSDHSRRVEGLNTPIGKDDSNRPERTALIVKELSGYKVNIAELREIATLIVS